MGGWPTCGGGDLVLGQIMGLNVYEAERCLIKLGGGRSTKIKSAGQAGSRAGARALAPAGARTEWCVPHLG